MSGPTGAVSAMNFAASPFVEVGGLPTRAIDCMALATHEANVTYVVRARLVRLHRANFPSEVLLAQIKPATGRSALPNGSPTERCVAASLPSPSANVRLCGSPEPGKGSEVPKKSERLHHIQARLREAGDRRVELEPRVDGKAGFRPDVLAYASNADGDLVPRVVVEVKAGLAKPESTLPTLLKAQELLGTVDHYCVINDEWYRADRSLRSLDRVEGPAEPAYGASGFLTDVSLAASLILDRLWFEADSGHGFVGRNDDSVPMEALFAETAMPGIETAGGDFIAVPPDVLWQARRRAVSAFSTRGRLDGDFTTDPLIADAIAVLVTPRLGGVVLDPFCGTGNFLWAALDQARQLDAMTKFYGQDINRTAAALAGAIAATAPLPTSIENGDSFFTDLPQADVVISAPPFGTRNSEPYELMDGTPTREYELAAVDVGLRQLRTGGRAAFLLSAGVTFKRVAESYRRFLANNFRIGALVGLPSGAYSHAGIRTVLLVIDRDTPRETFVAQLGDDWRTQLAPAGGALNAVLRHLDDDIDGE
jgi:hypothetical protein